MNIKEAQRNLFEYCVAQGIGNGVGIRIDEEGEYLAIKFREEPDGRFDGLFKGYRVKTEIDPNFDAKAQRIFSAIKHARAIAPKNIAAN